MMLNSEASNEELDIIENASLSLMLLSQWVDDHNRHRDPEAILWGRVAKVGEEAGEVMTELAGVTGQNPRKGVYSTKAKLREELLDLAVTALGAVEHLDGHQADAIPDMLDKIHRTWQRARES